ncbi:hypothetical protein EUZ85_10635 [Hahella sp. KA22]|uniref:hypothetical protein n=1 Tax=Hahella sp. KA22 TaxID=1628392 RepID=UPI000FDCE761|nr:hypothetical protein [Hahella sp. KA22]AZZ91160.1 hypothetical protein ENC22_08080 [Hahella sp. KA22]QAY54528.1 hypothetical protein EUZ85_10635 [Hahella sp. KA22]
MEISNNVNSDLIWDLDLLADRSKAQEFVLKFENKLCVFSGSVRQIYTNYSMHFPEDYNRNLVILPDPYAFHDTFNHIEEEAVTRTGFHIIPGELIKQKGMFMLIQPKDPEAPAKPIAMRKALEVLNKMRTESDPFLPILVKGDLKPFQDQIPCLHLHRLRLPLLHRASEFEKSELRRVIQTKMQDIGEL